MPETFAIAPAQSKALWVVVALILLTVLVPAAVMVITALGSIGSRVEVSERGVRLRGDLYGRFIPAEALRGNEARIVNLAAERELSPVARTMGTGLPGYRAGWFRLRNGEKALLYVTDGSRAVYVPTNRGYSLLLSPRDPERLVEMLRDIAPAP
ncbi:MAG TPA: PH domain-containing protein [Gemmatimonadaceae bacterium]